MNIQIIKRQLLTVAGISLIPLILSGSASLKETEKESVEEVRQSYICKRAVDQIKIDGILDEASWMYAEVIDLVTIKNVEGKIEYARRVAGLKTAARIFWDDSYLYVGFRTEDNDICATITEHDQDLSGEDVVEIFIDAEDGQSTYGEIQVNPLNTLFDQFVIWSKKGPVWMDYWADSRLTEKSDIKAGVNVEGTVGKRDDKDKYWSAELAIPHHLFVTARYFPPRAGQKWRINLTGINYFQNGLVEYVTWAKLGPKFFHDPENFADIIFSNDYVSGVKVIKSPRVIFSFESLEGVFFTTGNKVNVVSAQLSRKEKHKGNSSLGATIQFNRDWEYFEINFKDNPLLSRNGELALWVKGDTESNAKIHYEVVDNSGETYVGTLTDKINWSEWRELRTLISEAQLNKNKKDKILDFPVRLTKLSLYSRKVSEDTFYFDNLGFDEIELKLLR